MIRAKRDLLADRMIREGFTGAGLARAVRLTQGYVCQVVNGKRTILPPTAKKICDVLGCEFDDVFEIAMRKGDKNDDTEANN